MSVARWGWARTEARRRPTAVPTFRPNFYGIPPFFRICNSEALSISIFNAKNKSSCRATVALQPEAWGCRAVTSWQPHIISAGIEIAFFPFVLKKTLFLHIKYLLYGT